MASVVTLFPKELDMSLLLLLLIIINFYNPVTCRSQCKEYIIIMKETTCPTNTSVTREPITLDDIELNDEYCSANVSKTPYSDEKNSIQSFLIKYDYIGFDSICVPVFKSTKLLENLIIDPDDIASLADNEMNTKKITDHKDTETSLLKCIVKNFTESCDKEKSHEKIKMEIIRPTIDIDLIYTNKSTANNTELINERENSILFEQCILTQYTCKNFSTIDDYTKNSRIIIALLGNEPGLESNVINSNHTAYFSCANITNNMKKKNISLLNELTYSIVTAYVCQNEFIGNFNIKDSAFNIKVHIPTDLTITNTKLKSTYCKETFKRQGDLAMSLDCNTVEKKSDQSSAFDVNLIYFNDSAKINSIIFVYNETNSSLLFKHCHFRKNICVNHNTTDNHLKKEQNRSQTIFALLGHNSTSAPLTVKGIHASNFKCRSVNNKLKNINIDQITALTINIISKYDCQTEPKRSLQGAITPPKYNIKVFMPIDIPILNSKLQHINCQDNFIPINNNRLSIECNNEEMSIIETTTIKDTRVTDEHWLEINLSPSLIWYCDLINGTIKRDADFEIDEKLKLLKVFQYQDCTEGYSNINKTVSADGSDIIIISSVVNTKDNSTDKEHLEISIKNTVKSAQDCNAALFNFTNGGNINLWSSDVEGIISKELNSTLFKFMITNCFNNTEALKSNDSLEINIIVMNNDNLTLNEYLRNSLKIKLLNSTEKVVLICEYFNKTVNMLDLFNNKIVVMKCEAIVKEYEKIIEPNINNEVQDIFYISPTVIAVAIVSLLGVVTSVLVYALCLFRSRKSEYHVASTRDWSAMDETEF